MTSPGPNNTSDTARLMVNPPGFAIGWQEPVYIPNPPVGQVWSHTADGRYYERLISARWTLTTDAVAVTRLPRLQLLDTNGVVMASVAAGSGVAASSAATPTLVAGLSVLATGASGDLAGFLPDVLIPPGWTWAATVIGIDPGDQQSGIALLVQRFPNDATSITAGE